jgi:hypothetical protein
VTERIRDIAHVSAVELFTAVPDQTVGFLTDLMSLEVVARRADSVYLHAWDDYEAFTVKVTGAATPPRAACKRGHRARRYSCCASCSGRSSSRSAARPRTWARVRPSWSAARK